MISDTSDASQFGVETSSLVKIVQHDCWYTLSSELAVLSILRCSYAGITAYHVAYFLRNELTPSCLDGMAIGNRQWHKSTTSLDYEKVKICKFEQGFLFTRMSARNAEDLDV